MTMEYVITYFSLLSSLLISIIAYYMLTKEKIKINFFNVCCFLIFTGISLIMRISQNITLILLSNIFFNIITIKEFFNLRDIKAFYYSFVIIFISLLSDSLISMIISNNYLMNYNSFFNNYLFKILLNIPVSLLIIVICNIKKIRNLINNFYLKYLEKIRVINLSFSLITIFILITVFLFWLNAYREIPRIHHAYIVIGIILFIFSFIVALYLIYKEYQTKVLNKRIIGENKYMKDIARQEKEFKHNLINNLLGIKTVASKKVNQLIDELILEYRTDYKNILNINDLPDGVLSIIYRKAYEENIDNLNLAVDNKIKKDLIDMLSPKNYNKFCTSIGILFDNALDAVKSCKEKIIEINFLEDEEYIYYIQKNSFNNIIDLERTGTKEYTTKKSGHGIGLNYVKNLKNIETKNIVINNMFITKIKVKKIKM